MRTYPRESRALGYFEKLKPSIREMVKEMCQETFESECGEVWSEPQTENIECHSRDGFSAFDHNRGGVLVRGFTDLAALDGGGHSVAHKGAQAEIERQIAYSLECAQEGFTKKFAEELKSLGVKDEQANYHDLCELGRKTKNKRFAELAEELSEYERDNMSDEQSSIMYEIQFMYHGKLDGEHSASVSCAVNTEGPYHRRSISWAPGVFCEGAKEVEITFKTKEELKVKLAKALAETAKEVF